MNINNTMNSPYQYGYLEIILGSMYSGKSTRLVEIYNQCKFCDIPVSVINHDIDNRYDEELLSTHDQIKIPCLKTNKLKNIWNPDIHDFSDKISNDTSCSDKCLTTTYSKVILINEGQFFDDLYEVVSNMVNHGKQVYVCGLDGDFERKKFGQMLDLIPLCDKVSKLTSLCSICKNGTPGIFSMRLTNEKEQTIVGSSNYIPVCRECYMSKKHE
jgi:thymidine kinase